MKLWPRRLILSLFILLFAMCGAGVAAAQAPTGRLHGEVIDPTGAVVPNAAITLKSENGQTFAAKSDGIGTYTIKDLPPGTYTLAVVEKGFKPFTQQVEIAAGQERKFNITLVVYVKEEQVDVSGEAARVSVNPDNNASTVVISGKDLDALSDDPDELQSELQALAGPSAGPNGGQIYIDGFTGGQLPPKSSIREIRINQNPFSAQYDRMGFGRIEILTKPGTDKVHGQFFINDNHSIFDAMNPFAASEPDFSSQIFNGNMGGPLSKKASYFVNVERRDIKDAAVINPLAFSSAGVPVTNVLTPRVRTNTSARVDYQLTTNNTLTARYQFTHDRHENDGLGQFSLPSQAYNQTSTEHTIQISDTQILSPRAVNETRFEWEHNNTDQNSLSSLPAINVLGVFTGGGNPIGVGAVQSDHIELQNYTSMNRGNHFLRLGGRLRATAEDSRSTQNFNGTYTFDSLAAFQANAPRQLIIATGNPLISSTFVDAGLYAEDDWKLRPNMTLSYGLRFETQNGIHDHANWAPRVGFAWGLGGKKNTQPKTVIRTGFGIFYDRFGQNLILQAERLNGTNQQQFVIANPSFPNLPSLSSLAATPTTTYSINPSLRTPYTVQAAASVERQITKTATFTATYLHSQGVHQLFAINTNALVPGAAPAFQYLSEGIFNQNQLITNFNVRAGAKLTLFSYYVFSHANSDSAGAGNSPSNPALGITADYGRAPFDVRNRVFFGGSVALPRGFRVFPFMVVNSGGPFNITTGTDLNGDSIFNDRPSFASSATAPANLRSTPWGNFDVAPGPNDPRIPANFGTSPGQFTLNLRLSKTFGLGPKLETTANNGQQKGGAPQAGGRGPGGPGGGPGGHGPGPGGPGGGGRGPGGPGGGPMGMGERSGQKYNLTFSANARNIFNKVNPAPPVGNLSSPKFGESVALAGGPFNTQSANRRIDFQMMFAF
jgi:Carboxypeptidase regulatory-like domain